MTNSGQAYSAREISEIVGKSTRAIEIRAKRENWLFIKENGNGRGGMVKKYPIVSLPSDIQLAIYNNEGAPAELLPMLSPAVALAAMEGQVTAFRGPEPLP